MTQEHRVRTYLYISHCVEDIVGPVGGELADTGWRAGARAGTRAHLPRGCAAVAARSSAAGRRVRERPSALGSCPHALGRVRG